MVRMRTKGMMMLLLLLPLHSALAAPAEGTGKTFPGGTSDKEVAQLIHSMMDDQYGAANYNTKYNCWDIELQANGGLSTRYCMKPGPSQPVSESGATALYVLSYNRDDIAGDPDYSYSHSDLGLMGAFKAVHDDKTNQWAYVAGNRAMDCGTNGTCGCANAELVAMGANRHGWIFISGGSWQGTLVLNYAIVTDFDGKFFNVSAIPHIKEESQDVEYDVHVAGGRQNQAMFPLIVTKTKAGKKVEDITVPFDASKRIYALPEGK